MHLIKLNATPSTNMVLKELWQNEQPEDCTIVWAENQFSGRGQKGAIWESETGKNLTFSILKLFKKLEVQHQFLLNMIVSLSVYEVLRELKVPQISVKWPNDILSGSSKICGILIENMVKGKEVGAAIIGIGLNVNQENFGSLKGAASLKMITGNDFELEPILYRLVNTLKSELADFDPTSFNHLKKSYEAVMYRIHEVSTFEFPNGARSDGIIRGISEQGRLMVELKGSISTFDLKEIKLLNG